MNDFTLEELEDLLITTSEWGHYDLCTKIKSMIDEYCDPALKSDHFYRCIRCESKEIDEIYKIKFGLHDWFICIECSKMFHQWVSDKNADSGCGFSKEYFKRKYGGK